MAGQKNFRLNDELREEFERYCRDHLLDERAVVEAWLLRFLEAGDQERQVAAARYSQWLLRRKRPVASDQSGKRTKPR